MTIYITVLILFVALSIFLCVWGDRDMDGPHYFAAIAGVLGCAASLLGLAILAFGGLEWVGAKHKAGIINREYGTQYTQAEVFYASSVIDTVRELDRKRYEINGDIRRAQADASVQARREQKK